MKKFDCTLVEITDAEPVMILHYLLDKKIEVYDVHNTGPLCIRFYIKTVHLNILIDLIQQRGGKFEIIHNSKAYGFLRSVIKRPVMILTCILLSLLTVVLSNRILLVQIEGNQSLSEKHILEESAACGVSFGVRKNRLDANRFKTQLLSKIPELRWAGFSTNGCIATVRVAEKLTTGGNAEEFKNISHIVALYDGVITNCTVYSGTPLCQVGQAVIAGQKLVSGFTDCGITTIATQARAEITADTLRKITAIIPDNCYQRGECIDRKTSTYIQIGKKLINLFNCSRISDTTCVKMYEKKYVSLPGGWQTPIAILKEHNYYYELTYALIDEQSAKGSFEMNLNTYLKSKMIAGSIISADEELVHLPGAYMLTGNYNCRESIGVSYKEECFSYNGKTC